MSGVDGDSARLFLRRVVDLVIATDLAAELLVHRHGDGGGQRRLAVVHVTDGTDVDMRFASFEFFLGHFCLPYRLLAFG